MGDLFEGDIERERRFLVKDKSIVDGYKWIHIEQGYLWLRDGFTGRVRIIGQENEDGRLVNIDATHTIKGPRVGDERFESEKSFQDFDVARKLLQISEAYITKRRYQLVDQEPLGHWEVDVFTGAHTGLVIAEIEARDIRRILLPSWVGREVTNYDRYNNEYLAYYGIPEDAP